MKRSKPQSDVDWLDVFPPSVREVLLTLYGALGEEQSDAISVVVEEVGRYMSADDFKHVLELVREQFPDLGEASATICIVGPVNTGKSSLYNALISEDQVRAEVSPVPGTTQSPQAGASGILTVVDTPGADDVEVGREGQQAGRQRREAALAAARQADFLVIVFDASVGIGQGALTVYRDLTKLGKPYLIVLNKIDLVEKYQDQVIQLAARHLGVGPESIVATSALEGTGLDRLIFAIVRSKPDLVLAVAEALPRYRFKLAQRRTIQAATAAGTVNLATSPIPIPFTSFVPLVGIQAGLVLSIARIYSYQLTAGRAKELLATFAAGLGARTLFQQLITKIPGAGWALGTAIAAATTLTIGYSAIAWFDRGERLTAQATRAYAETIAQEIVDALRNIDRKTLSREGLKTTLEGIGTQFPERFRGEAPQAEKS
jgi:small GTP-binding protein